MYPMNPNTKRREGRNPNPKGGAELRNINPRGPVWWNSNP